MARLTLAASTLSAALGLALGALALPASADDMAKDASKMSQGGMDKMDKSMQGKMEKCYGVNAVAKNDCSEGAHSCAGQADKARDPKSFVMLPAGACEKIAGGKTKST